MCGDSLMRTYAANASDQTGWGQVLDQFLSADANVDNTLSNGGRSSRSLYAGNTLDKSFRITPFGDVTGTITLTAPAGYSLATGATFAPNAVIACDASYAGTIVNVRFAPTEATAYNGDLVVAHTSTVPDYGNSVANTKAGTISLTGNGKAAVAGGAPASVTWPMFSGTTITLAATTDGPISANQATITGLVNKNVLNGGARFDSLDGTWPAESARNPNRYLEFSVPVDTGTFTLDSVSVGGGSGGGSNMRWDIVYSLAPDFSAPTVLEAAISGAKDTLVTSTYPSLGVAIPAGQTLYLRVYPYSTAAAASGKSIMVANVVVSGVTN
jgi:hypothetical protein